MTFAIFLKTPILKDICEQLLLFVLSEITFRGDGYEGKKYFEPISLNSKLKSVFASYRQKNSITSLICYLSSQQVGKISGWLLSAKKQHSSEVVEPVLSRFPMINTIRLIDVFLNKPCS